MMQQHPDLGRAAQWYAEKLGWPVAPAHWIEPSDQCSCRDPKCSSPGKHPIASLAPHGFQDATKDLETIEKWWAQYPKANIIVPTGSPSGIWALDVDPAHGGGDSLADLEAQDELLPVSQEQITGGNGRHLMFNHPGPAFRNTAGKLGAGLDTRGEGGYIIAAPSNHKSGNLYRWKEGQKPGQVELADVPAWLLDRLRKKEPKALSQPQTGNGDATAYVEAALAGEQQAVAKAQHSTRNHQLNSSAFALGQFVGAGLLDQGRVERALTDAAMAAGLDDIEIPKTIKSGLEAGLLEPREVPEPSFRPNDTRRRSESNGAGSEDLQVLQAATWRDFAPLPALIPRAPILPPEMTPAPLRAWLCDSAERAQVSLESIAAPAIVGLSGMIAGKVGVLPKQHDPDFEVVANLWGLEIARPSLMKTYCVKEGTRPLRRLAALAHEDFEQRELVGEADKEILEAEVVAAKANAQKAAKTGDKAALAAVKQDLMDLVQRKKDEQVTERRYIVNDSSTEKLGELLNENPQGLVLIRDELSGWLSSLERQDRQADRFFYMESWNGIGGFTYDRIGRGTIHVDSLRLSVFGGMTPARLRSYFNGVMQGVQGDDGLLQRFQLLVWPEMSESFTNVDRPPEQHSRDSVFEIYQRLDQLGPTDIGAQIYDGDIPFIRFAPNAQELFTTWREDLEQRCRSVDLECAPAFESHLIKYRSLMPSLALVFHVIDVVATGRQGSISLEAAELAAAWCDFLERHARKVYAPELHPKVAAAHALLEKIDTGAVEHGMRVRDIYNAGWSGLSDTGAVCDGLALCQAHHMLQVVENKTGGRPSNVVLLHPALRRAA
jgi:putative DNA primase/helicase